MAQVFGNLAQADRRIGTDAGLLIVRGSSQVPQQFAVDGPVGQFANDRQDGLDGLFPDDGGSIGKTGRLDRSLSMVQRDKLSQTHHLWENLIIYEFLRQAIDHQGQIVQQADPQSTVRIGKQTNNDRGQSRRIFVVCEFGSNLQNGTQDLRPSTPKFDRFEQFWEHFQLDELFWKVIRKAFQLTIHLVSTIPINCLSRTSDILDEFLSFGIAFQS